MCWMKKRHRWDLNSSPEAPDVAPLFPFCMEEQGGVGWMMSDLLVTEMKITIIPFKSTDKPASATAVAFHPLTEKAEPNLCVCVCS